MLLVWSIIFALSLWAGGQDDTTSTVAGRVTMTGGTPPLRVAMVQDADSLIKEFDTLVGELAGKQITKVASSP